MKLYIGNLPYTAAEPDLQKWFTQAGVTVDSVTVMRDRFSGEARGFGFVEISNEKDAHRAISALNGKQLMGRTLVVNEARPMATGGGGGTRTRAAGSGGSGDRPQRRERSDY
jgi:cold-inducible RNA-binding protein